MPSVIFNFGPLVRVINVSWAGDGFLYSGDDGMFGSTDGTVWRRAPSAVPARSLACVDGVWVACSSLAGVWRSTDGARKWNAVPVPMFEEVGAFKPAGKDERGKPKPGVFLGWATDDEYVNQDIYASYDLGKSWSKVHSIPLTVAADGNEKIRTMVGCGSRGFVTTVRNEGPNWADAGWIYSTTDGRGFSGRMVFGPPTFNPPGPFKERVSYTAGGVGFDGNRYIAVGMQSHNPAEGKRVDTYRYLISVDGSFGSAGEGTQFDEAKSEGFDGEVFGVPWSAAGGEGSFATGASMTRISSESGLVGGEGRAYFPGRSVTALPPADQAQRVGSFCKKRNGPFGCVAFADPGNGVFIAKPNGSWRQVRSGSGFPALAVGRVGF